MSARKLASAGDRCRHGADREIHVLERQTGHSPELDAMAEAVGASYDTVPAREARAAQLGAFVTDDVSSGRIPPRSSVAVPVVPVVLEGAAARWMRLSLDDVGLSALIRPPTWCFTHEHFGRHGAGPAPPAGACHVFDRARGCCRAAKCWPLDQVDAVHAATRRVLRRRDRAMTGLRTRRRSRR